MVSDMMHRLGSAPISQDFLWTHGLFGEASTWPMADFSISLCDLVGNIRAKS